MQAAAWKFGHKKHLLMDLAFGVCSAQALLTILMALDENGTGTPICFIKLANLHMVFNSIIMCIEVFRTYFWY